MIDLKSKTVLITGGTKGIGKACVEIFAKANADIIFTYRSDKKSADELEKKFNSVKIKSYQSDLNNTEEIESKVKDILKENPRIDILVNNAGIWRRAESDLMTLEEWEETLRINLTGTFLFTKAVIPVMKKNKSGKIINISSTAGQRGEAYYSHYAASKGAVISYTKSLAAELGEYGITVNCVAPGWVETEMTSEVFSDKNYKAGEAERIPLKRIAAAEDIAGPVLFLASDLARHINGEILNVNGGSVLCG